MSTDVCPLRELAADRRAQVRAKKRLGAPAGDLVTRQILGLMWSHRVLDLWSRLPPSRINDMPIHDLCQKPIRMNPQNRLDSTGAGGLREGAQPRDAVEGGGEVGRDLLELGREPTERCNRRSQGILGRALQILAGVEHVFSLVLSF